MGMQRSKPRNNSSMQEKRKLNDTQKAPSENRIVDWKASFAQPGQDHQYELKMVNEDVSDNQLAFSEADLKRRDLASQMSQLR